LNTHTFHISPYDIAFLGAIFIGLNFALLLSFVKSINRSANRLLALALLTMILWMMRILAIDIRLQTYLPGWDRIPMQFLLLLGPLIYFYVLKITRPEYRFGWTDLLHFSPLLFEQGALALEIRESIRTGATTYATVAFRRLNPALELLIFISIITYLYRSHKLIQNFYQRLQPILMDRSRLEFRWLRRLLMATALLWLLWISYAAIDYFGYRNQLNIHVYYPVYIFFAVIIIWTAAAAFLRPQAGMMLQSSTLLKPSPPAELREKGSWLKKEMEAKLYYRDPELNLTSLAEKLNLHHHELSRIINIGLKKNFNDLINEYRIRDVVSKMQAPAYARLTLLGIALESGFNSKSTFHRTFKQMTGKSPAEYKRHIKKELPPYHLRPFSYSAAVISTHVTTPKWSEEKLNRNYMFRNYLKIAWRNLIKNKASSFINIGGLSVGMAVAMLIGLWIWDELSFDKYHRNYDRVATVMQHLTFNGNINTGPIISLPLDAELRKSYGSYFKHIAISAWTNEHVLIVGDKKVSFPGTFMGSEAPEIFSLKMLKGTLNGIKDPSSMLISQSVAKALFGDADPVGKVIKLDNKDNFNVSGVYEDLPSNTTLHDVAFMGSFDYYIHAPGNERSLTDWGDNSLFMYVQVADNADMDKISEKIRNVKLSKMSKEDLKFNPLMFLQPMSKWHLYSEFKNGVNVGGAIQYVWLFGIIGVFVLLLACINFMNLSTARSEKRAKEVGIRKAVGSLRGQLIKQFYCESFLIATLAFVASLLMVWLAMPYFNDVANKQLSILWSNPLFWAAAIGFTLFTGIIAGSYPALYLSSFNPVKVLKGTFKAGRFAAIPRKVLVVLQFTVSVILIVGTIIVFKQIQFAKNRPVGYSRDGLLAIEITNDDLHKHFDAMRTDLLNTGTITEMAESSSSTTGINNNRGDVSWQGKDPALSSFFGNINVTPTYGKTVGWQFTEGRDFAAKFLSDSSAIVLNQAAVKYMNLKNPVGQIVKVGKKDLTVIGVIKDMVMESPYEPVKQSIFRIGRGALDNVLIKINPNVSAHDALGKIEAVCKTYSPSVPFSYKFADDEYAKKFATEERIGKLASCFAGLAIFISCLGLFGMASFMAEQRIKEIGVRKVLGASVFGLWRLMSRDFVALVIVSLLIATPVSYYFMHNWLQHYTYRAELSWWIFAVTAAGAVAITLMTVSYQSIKAALANPVKSLKTE